MTGHLQSSKARLFGLAAGAALLLGCMLASVLFGLQHFHIHTLWQAYTDFNGSTEHMILTQTRVPRTMVGAVVGASLAMAGAMMQVLTKNPLASPSVFGINSGAIMFIVVSLAFVGSDMTLGAMIWLALIGAAVTALFVFALGSRGRDGFTPIKVTLAGSAIAAFAASVTSGIMIINQSALDQAMFWLVGSLSNRTLEHLSMVLPYVAIGWVLALALSGSLNVMALGDEVSKGLGQRLLLIKVIASAAIVLMAGSSVAIAGPIAFVGVIVPHLCRFLVGNNHRWLLPYCAVAGALLLVAADLASRFIIMPKEVPVGVATALLGVPFLIYVARRGKYE